MCHRDPELAAGAFLQLCEVGQPLADTSARVPPRLALAEDVPGLQIPISHLEGSALLLQVCKRLFFCLRAGSVSVALSVFVARARHELCSPMWVNRKGREGRLVQDKPSSQWFLASCDYWRQWNNTSFHLPRIQPIRSAASPILWVKINSCGEARILCKCAWIKPGEFSHKRG